LLSAGRGQRPAGSHSGRGEAFAPRVTTPARHPPRLGWGRWAQLSLAEQLANVGAEVGRMRPRRAGEDRARPFERALELLDLTLADPRWREIGRASCRERVWISVGAVSLKEKRRWR